MLGLSGMGGRLSGARAHATDCGSGSCVGGRAHPTECGSGSRVGGCALSFSVTRRAISPSFTFLPSLVDCQPRTVPSLTATPGPHVSAIPFHAPSPSRTLPGVDPPRFRAIWACAQRLHLYKAQALCTRRSFSNPNRARRIPSSSRRSRPSSTTVTSVRYAAAFPSSVTHCRASRLCDEAPQHSPGLYFVLGCSSDIAKPMQELPSAQPSLVSSALPLRSRKVPW